MKSIFDSPFMNKDEEEKSSPKMPESVTEKFLKTRQIILSGEINKDLAEKIVSQLLVLEADDCEKTIYMYIDSPGGDVDAGFAIFDMIRFIKAPVVLIGMGLIASAATLILLAVPKERRLGLPNSNYLIHQPMSGMKGVATDIEIHAKEMEKTIPDCGLVEYKNGTHFSYLENLENCKLVLNEFLKNDVKRSK